MNVARRHIPEPRLSSRARAMTLTELMVVIGIIVLVLGLAVPAISVWESRKVQDAINLTAGLLQRTQTRAMTEKRVIGLFFFIEPETQTQYVWPIEPAMITNPPGSADQTADRFVLRDTEPFKLPKPMRVVPISVLDDPAVAPPHLGWSAAQLADNELRDPPQSNPDDSAPYPDAAAGEEGTQFHRNYFVILFNRDGTVISNRRAFIVDRDDQLADYPSSQTMTETCPGGGITGSWYKGFRTGLAVTDNTDPSLWNVVVDENCSPIRFTSATSVLIYNDDAFRTEPSPTSSGYMDNHRVHLKQLAQPLYIHPLTGRIIKGKTGEA